MSRRSLPLFVLAAALLGGVASIRLDAETRRIDTAQSTLTVYVSKTGLFSAFADNHIVSAPISNGSMADQPPLAVELIVRVAELKVLDPNLAADKRAEVQTRMLGAEVLDAATFPEITFASTMVDDAGADRWKVTGRLTIHGRMRVVTFPVARMNGRYRGEVLIKQRDFGIEPISIAGGAVKVKDELKIQFEIAPAG